MKQYFMILTAVVASVQLLSCSSIMAPPVSLLSGETEQTIPKHHVNFSGSEGMLDVNQYSTGKEVGVGYGIDSSIDVQLKPSYKVLVVNDTSEYVMKGGQLQVKFKSSPGDSSAFLLAAGYSESDLGNVMSLHVGQVFADRYKYIGFGLLFGAYLNIPLQAKDVYVQLETFDEPSRFEYQKFEKTGGIYSSTEVYVFYDKRIELNANMTFGYSRCRNGDAFMLGMGSKLMINI